MTLGNKLAKLRRENNYTQEQLADVLGVSRQSVSKWESDIAFPETDKLIQISKIFNCSLDYLLKDSEEDRGVSGAEKTKGTFFSFNIGSGFNERKSEKTVFGMPLFHMAKNAKGFFAIGLNAKGVFAIGLKAAGVVSCGILSIGVVSWGLLSLGLAAIGLLALGGLSFGCFALGIAAWGAISFGFLSFGAVAVGDFSVGAYSVGKYFAMGDKARAMVAVGKSGATGSLFQKIGGLTSEDIAIISSILDEKVPAVFAWIKNIVISLL